MNTFGHAMVETVTFNLQVSKAAHDRLKTLAQTVGRSTEALATLAIESYLDLDTWQVEAIREAVEKADAGGPFIHHEDAVAYFEALGRGDEPSPPPSFRTR